MITVPTTLVLGAGASKPYGFPTGRELRAELCSPSKLQGLNDKFSDKDIQVFCDAFQKSQMPSIDAFLGRRGDSPVWCAGSPTFSELGKAAIAYRLMQREVANQLFQERADHWYQYLWSKISDSLDSFPSNKLRIITFNYDRSLEAYLLTALQHAFGVPKPQAASLLCHIPILHVYGQLGSLPELNRSTQGTRPYDADDMTPLAIAVAASGIRVIDEHRDDDEIFAKAYEYLSTSNRICFIGFGFDATNVRRLQLARLTIDPAIDFQVYSTTVGLEDAERNWVINTVCPKTTPGRPTFGDTSTADHIAKYPDHLPERYLRATGVLS